MVRSLAFAALAALLFASCQSVPPTPLALQGRFPIDYRGRVQAVERSPAGAESLTNALAERRPATGTLGLRLVVVEVPRREVGAALAWLQGREFQGSYLDRAELGARLAGWRQQNTVLAEPSLATSLGSEVACRVVGRRSFVSHWDFEFGENSYAVNPTVEAYEYGLEFTLCPRRDGDATKIAFACRSRETVDPVKSQLSAGGHSLQVEQPMMFDQRVTGEAAVVPGMAMLVGTMVGSGTDSVRLLWLDCEPSVLAAPLAAQ